MKNRRNRAEPVAVVGTPPMAASAEVQRPIAAPRSNSSKGLRLGAAVAASRLRPSPFQHEKRWRPHEVKGSCWLQRSVSSTAGATWFLVSQINRAEALRPAALALYCIWLK